MPRVFALAIAIVALAIAATFVSGRWASFGNPPVFDIAAECARFASNPITDDAEVWAFLAKQRKEYKRLDNTDMVARIDEFVTAWEPRRDERQARAWASYEQACLPEPNKTLRRTLSL